MIAAFDACHADGITTTACVAFADWADDATRHERVVRGATPDEYVPGEFYRRELPGLLAAWAALPARAGLLPADLLIVDGYVWLDTDRPGLGHHLHTAIAGAAPVIGVAKTAFRGAPAIEVLRGGSVKPLFVTAIGVDPATAAGWVAAMAGAHRMPDLLRRVDALSKGHAAPRED